MLQLYSVTIFWGYQISWNRGIRRCSHQVCWKQRKYTFTPWSNTKFFISWFPGELHHLQMLKSHWISAPYRPNGIPHNVDVSSIHFIQLMGPRAGSNENYNENECYTLACFVHVLLFVVRNICQRMSKHRNINTTITTWWTDTQKTHNDWTRKHTCHNIIDKQLKQHVIFDKQCINHCMFVLI